MTGEEADDVIKKAFAWLHKEENKMKGKKNKPLNFDVLDKAVDNQNRLTQIGHIIELVDQRCLCADGCVPKTTEEITDDEMRQIYLLAVGNRVSR